MSAPPPPNRFTAFAGDSQIGAGDAVAVALAVKSAARRGLVGALVFDDATGREIDFDLRGSDDDLRDRLAAPSADLVPQRAGRGRPRLGVVAREVTLLPRHWDWLSCQPGGASAALRRLVDEARKNGGDANQLRRAKDAAFRAMSALAGDRPGFEEASRALYANDEKRFRDLIAVWPSDIRDYVQRLAGSAGEASVD